MTHNAMGANGARDPEIYYHLVNDTVRADAILRKARDMRSEVIRSMVVAIVTAPARLFDRVAEGFGSGAPHAPKGSH